MRISLSLPASVRVTSGALLAASLDDDALLDQLVRRFSARLAIVARELVHTERGWPVVLVRARAGDEQRIAAMYQFGEWRGFALACFDDAALASQIVDALRAAQPDWRGDGEIHCIAELYA